MLRLFARKPQLTERRSVTLALDDGGTVEVALRPHPRARRLKLAVDERGVRLTLPPRTGERAALQFLHAQRAWLQAQLQAVAGDTASELIIGRSAQLPLRGEVHQLEWRPARSTRVCRMQQGAAFEVRGLPAVAGAAATPVVRRALRDFYEAEARADVARWLPRHAHGLPRPPARIAFKRMSSQWGSLSPAGVVALDLALVLARPSAFEYVLVHELCHLIHADHSPAYWREVEARWPRWREERDYLHAHGRRLKATLRALCG